MSRKRLGRLDPNAASRARDAAEKAVAEKALADKMLADKASAGKTPGEKAALRGGPPIARMAAGVGQEIDAEIRRLKTELQAQQQRAATLDAAEAEGRVIVAIDLDQIELEHLTRDRRALDRNSEDWRALKASLKARGQQTPVEVVDLGADRADRTSPRYGLISGLRRISVLRELLTETGEDRFALVLALIRPALPTPEKLIAMIEENEIRRSISFYERGRIAVIATQQGIFGDTDIAVDALFPRSDRNRRYKIRCFATICENLDHHLEYPEAIGERLGLEIARLIREGGTLDLVVALDGFPDRDQAQELDVLTRTVNGDPPYRKTAGEPSAALKPRSTSNRISARWEGGGGVTIRARAEHGGDRVTLQIEGLNGLGPATLERLVEVLGSEVGE